MGKKSTKEVLGKIIKSLMESPKTIKEISKKTKSDRGVVSKYLKVLVDVELVNVEKEGNKKIFVIVGNEQKHKTYFGLPLDKKTENIIDSIYYLIQKEWKKKRKDILGKTTAQKIIYGVIKKTGLKVPIGMYLYGGICIKPYDYSEDYNCKIKNKNIIKAVKEEVIKYSKTKSREEAKQVHYLEKGEKLYFLKEQIFNLLYSENFSKDLMYDLQKTYLEFLFLKYLLELD